MMAGLPRRFDMRQFDTHATIYYHCPLKHGGCGPGLTILRTSKALIPFTDLVLHSRAMLLIANNILPNNLSAHVDIVSMSGTHIVRDLTVSLEWRILTRMGQWSQLPSIDQPYRAARSLRSPSILAAKRQLVVFSKETSRSL
jgi:hypothetical protein